MFPCIICSFRHRAQTNQQELRSTASPGELKESDKISSNALSNLLVVLTLSGSKALLPAALALLTYTISLRVAANSCFVHDHPILTRFLHAVPLLGTFCMAGVELAFDIKSPALAVIVLLLSALPLFTILIHHGRNCQEVPLPIRVQEPSLNV